MKEIFGFVYLTTNLVNGKRYIGRHKGKESDSYLGSGIYIKPAIKKYGKHNFKRETLAYAYTNEELNELEKYYIKLYNAVEDKMFYNVAEGGYIQPKVGGMKGKKHSQETKSKISDSLKGNPNLNTQGMAGKKHTDDAKQKMSETRKEKGLSKGTKNPMYDVHLVGELNPMYGKTGENAINGKKVYKYQDKEKTIIVAEYNTVGLALKDLNVKGHRGLDNAIKNNTEYKGYYWDKGIK